MRKVKAPGASATSLACMIGIAGVAIVLGTSCSDRVAPGVVAAEPGRPLTQDDTIYTLITEPVRTSIDVVGTAVSERNIQLSARMDAYVDEVLISAGESVTNGQILLRLDSREIEQQYTAAEAQFVEAQQDFERTRQLMQRDAATEKDLDVAQARFTAGQARLDQVRVMRSYTVITSPIDGVVADRRIEAGDLAAPGTILVTVYDPGNMRLEVPVPIRLLDHVSLDQDMEVVMDYPARMLTGTVTEILGEIDPSSRTRTVKVHLTGDCHALPGTFGRLRVVPDERPAIVAPATAVRRNGQLESVELVRGDRVVRRLVKTVSSPDGRREVISGLNPGDTIVLPAHGDSSDAP